MKNKKKDYIFVLWGDNFNSLATATFVTQLRKAGLRVKLVALSRQSITGTQGLTLLPDITVEQALKKINKIHCIIIPPYYSNGLLNDPRINHLLKSEVPLLVIPEDLKLSQTKPVCSPCKRGSTSLQEKITYVPNDDDYLNFTRQLAIYFSNY